MVTIARLLELPVFQGSTVAAGAEGLDRSVRYIDIAEVPDVRFWVNPDVFILTTAYAFHKEPRALMLFVKGLVKNRAAALGIKLGRFLDELPDEFCKYADRHKLPVVLLPGDLRYTHAIRSVTEAILEEERANPVSGNLNENFKRLLYGDSLVEPLENFEAMGFLRSAKASVVVIGGAPAETHIAKSVLKGLFEEHGDLCAVVETPSETILLADALPSPELDITRCANFFPEQLHAGVGREYPLREIRRSFEDARWVLGLIKVFSAPKGIYFFRDLELFDPLLRGAARNSAAEAAARLLRPVLEYDAHNNAELLETLWTFILCDRDHRGTALRLHLHRNSLRYRLSKIESLFGRPLEGVFLHHLFLALAVFFTNRAPG